MINLLLAINLNLSNPILDKPKEPMPIVKVVTWQDNPNKCDESHQWIAQEPPFVCIEKDTTQAQKPVRTSQNASHNDYPVGQCTQYVKSMRPDIPNTLGDAYLWFDELRDLGWAVGYTPKAGAIGVSVYGNHVVYIQSVSGNQVYLSERNWDYNGSYRERWADASSFKYVY